MESSIKTDGELSILVERTARFIQLLRIHLMVLTHDQDAARSEPSITMSGTMLSVVYSFFYSLIERGPKCLDFFRIWSDRRPEFSQKLSALAAEVEPFREALRLHRNRIGFHGSVSRDHERDGYAIFELDAQRLLMVMLAVRDLSTELIVRRSVGDES